MQPRIAFFPTTSTYKAQNLGFVAPRHTWLRRYLTLRNWVLTLFLAVCRNALCLLFICVSNGGCVALCTAVLCFHFTRLKGMQFCMCFPRSAILHRFSKPYDFTYASNKCFLDTFSKKRNLYTLVVSAVMCNVSLLSLMLCCIML